MGRKGKAPKQRRRRLDPQEALVHQILNKCQKLPGDGLDEVLGCSHLTDIWSGLGVVYKVLVRLASGEEQNLIVKLVNMQSSSCSDAEVRRRCSYRVEANFYERGHARLLNDCGAKCPSAEVVECDGADFQLAFCMSRLEGLCSHSLSVLQTEAALCWLARLHGAYWGTRADDAVCEGGLQQQGCFWSLDTRSVEHANMPIIGWQGRLRLAARGIDLRLKADRCQTIIHGDAKAENMLFSGCAADGLTVGFCDFQYVGKAHPAKDLAYCLLSVDKDVNHEERAGFLGFYLSQLAALLESQGDDPPTLRELHIAYDLSVCDFARWMSGWGWLGFEARLREACAATLDAIDNGCCLDSEEAYTEAVFATFPI